MIIVMGEYVRLIGWVSHRYGIEMPIRHGPLDGEYSCPLGHKCKFIHFNYFGHQTNGRRDGLLVEFISLTLAIELGVMVSFLYKVSYFLKEGSSQTVGQVDGYKMCDILSYNWIHTTNAIVMDCECYPGGEIFSFTLLSVRPKD